MKYRSGYKYQLAEDFSIMTPIHPKENIITRWICLSSKGYLTISCGYAWDGCSGPTYDSKNSMIAGLVHDALYQLCRNNRLPKSERKKIDLFFKELLIKNGMFKWRANLWYQAVRKFGSFAADPKNIKKIYLV
jgi:hypothetical protein